MCFENKTASIRNGEEGEFSIKIVERRTLNSPFIASCVKAFICYLEIPDTHAQSHLYTQG